MASPQDLLTVARQAAARAAAYLREVARPADPAGWATKRRGDFVTLVDRTAESMIADILLAAEPGSAIVGEEHSPDLVGDGLVWVIDPLDGTTNFLHGYPQYAVSVAAAVDGVLEAGVVHQVPANQVAWASRGGGAWLDGQPLAVSPIEDPAYALIGTGIPFSELSMLDQYLGQLRSVVSRTTGVRRAGSAAIDLRDVAAGYFEGFWEQRLSAWDIAAGILLVREAGGRVTDNTGRDLGVEHGAVVAGNPAIHAWLLEAVRG